MSHLEVMVNVHVHLFQTKITIRKIPSSAATMLAHNFKSSTFHRHAMGVVLWLIGSKGRAGEGKGGKSLKS